VIPKINRLRKNSLRQFAEACRNEIPSGEKIWTPEFPYRPFWYYLEPDIAYYHEFSDIPQSGRFILISTEDAIRQKNDAVWSRTRPVLLKTLTDKTRTKLMLFEITAHRSG
jgi:hypothetical protein